MRRWTKQIRALDLFGEKNRLGRGSNLGQAGGNLCLWGPERFFSIVRNAQYNYPLFGRTEKASADDLSQPIGYNEDAKKAGEGIRTLDVQLGKLTFYH